jgi:prophage antirepressor-like protein
MTPQMQLTLSKVFEEKEIRAMDLDGELWVPVVDLADAWGVDRSTLTKIINRNPDIFKKLSTVVDFTSPNQIPLNPQTVNNSLRLVNERGMIILGLKVSSSHIQNAKAKEKIIEFQLWVPQLLQDLRKGMVQLTAPQQFVPISHVQRPVDILNDQLDAADILIKRSGMPKEIAHAMAVTLAGELSNTNLQPFASYIKAQSKQLQITDGCKPVDQADFDAHFSLKYIANILKLSEDKTRNILESKNILCYKNKMWHLTTYGEKYGKAFKVQIGYPYRSIQQVWIRYNPELIKMLRLEYHIETTKVE